MNINFVKSSFSPLIFYLLLITVSFNIFRESGLYLVLYFLLSLLGVIFFFLNVSKLRPKNTVGWTSYLFVMSSISVAIVSALHLKKPDFLNAASRFYFVYPLFFSALLCLNIKTFRTAIQLYLLIAAGAACCLIYQVYFGSIPYFVESSTRGDIARYATFLGALPTFGVAGAFALLFIGFSVRNIFFFGLLFFLLFTGLILTLQKAALANLVIILIFMFWMSFKGKLSLNPAKLFGIVVFSAVFNFFAFNDHVLVNIDFLGIKLHRSNSNLIGWTGYGMVEDATMRLKNHFLESHTSASTTSSSVNLEISQNTGSKFFGVGYEALGGALGLDQYPMSHNGIVDIWRLGGVPYMLVFLLLCLSVVYQLKFLKYRNDFDYYGLAFFALFALNFIFYTGIFVNPSLAILFWINLAYLSVKDNVT